MFLEILLTTTAVFSAPPAFRFVKGKLPPFPNIKGFLADWESSDPETGSMLFPGAARPTTILAHMIVAEILRDGFEPVKNTAKVKDFTISWVPFEEKSIVIDGKTYNEALVKAACDSYSKKTGNSPGWWKPHEISHHERLKKHVLAQVTPVVEGLFSGKVQSVRTSLGLEFNESEMKILCDGVTKALRLYTQRQKNLAAEKNQQAAVDVIEKVMGVKKPELSVPQENEDEILSIQAVKS